MKPGILPPWAETLRLRLFASPVDAVVTLLCLYIVWRISVPLVDWLLIDATWSGTTREDCRSPGACWVFIRARFGQFMYGQYPIGERWRVDLLGLLIVGAAALKYINRVSDFLFVAARAVNDNGAGDVLWVPGQNR